MYDLLPAENYKLPPEAEGLEAEAPSAEDKRHTVTSIAKPPSHHNDSFDHDDDRNSLHARRSNTARHSSRPSTGSAVTTVIEEGEDEHPEVTHKMKGMHISAPSIAEEESEVEVPVIVEGATQEPTLTGTGATELSENAINQDHLQGQTTSDKAGSAQEESGDIQDMPLLSQELSQEPSEHIAESQPSTDNDSKQEAVDSSSEAPLSTAAGTPQGAVESSPGEDEEESAPENPSTE
ncbi:hypothetical protein O1611_g10174 [Lasiodiplodia mahajangana]|uniref:Uncharacterized protein n=1 Tax=Lasiodiplodia mahajangana TaxID=1108764 RepID=A0ACC2J142_9PEZI|nr:hypothetical protein O1611_g10174 [Lasiodiplodia mahajangana]